jgi:hypothetical protein
MSLPMAVFLPKLNEAARARIPTPFRAVRGINSPAMLERDIEDFAAIREARSSAGCRRRAAAHRRGCAR